MKITLFLSLILGLSGCSLTPEQREALTGIASGMQSAGQAMNQDNQLRRQRMHEQNLQDAQQNQFQPRTTTNCTTRYNSYSKEYETSCY